MPWSMAHSVVIPAGRRPGSPRLPGLTRQCPERRRRGRELLDTRRVAHVALEGRTLPTSRRSRTSPRGSTVGGARMIRRCRRCRRPRPRPRPEGRQRQQLSRASLLRQSRAPASRAAARHRSEFPRRPCVAHRARSDRVHAPDVHLIEDGYCSGTEACASTPRRERRVRSTFCPRRVIVARSTRGAMCLRAARRSEQYRVGAGCRSPPHAAPGLPGELGPSRAWDVGAFYRVAARQGLQAVQIFHSRRWAARQARHGGFSCAPVGIVGRDAVRFA